MAKCGKKTEVYSRVVGYHRPTKNWNRGKQEEFKDRKPYVLATTPAKTSP
jgi:ribonucleoside-triphosphate reductase